MGPQFWPLMAVVSFWCWVVATGFFIARAFPNGQYFDSQQAFRWGGLVLLFGLCWVIGLANA